MSSIRPVSEVNNPLALPLFVSVIVYDSIYKEGGYYGRVIFFNFQFSQDFERN